MKRIAVHIILICFCHVFAVAQDHEYFQYTVKDGLPTNHVYGVMEDEDGNIWAYTENGMAKFDGYQFQTYNTKDGLPTNDIVQAVRDDDGRMWLWPFNGPPTYIYKDSIHIVSKENCAYIHKIDNRIRYSCIGGFLMEMKNGGMEIVNMKNDFILDHKELFPLDSVRYNPAGKSSQYFFSTDTKIMGQVGDSLLFYSNPYAIRYFILDDGYLLVNHLTRSIVRKKNGKIKSIELDIKSQKGESILMDKLGLKEKFVIHFSSSEKSVLIDFEKEKWKWITPVDSLLELQAVYLHSVSDHSFAIDGQNGFLSFDFDGHLIDELKLKDLPKQLFLQRFYKDRNQNIWIGAREGGIIMIPASNRKTELLTSRFSIDQSFEQILKTRDGQLLAFTDNSGVYQIKDKNIIQLYAPKKGGRLMDVVDTQRGVLVSSSSSSFLIPYKNGKLVFLKNKIQIQASSKDLDKNENLQLLVGLKRLVFDSIHQNIYATLSAYHQLYQYQFRLKEDILYSPCPISNVSAMVYDDQTDRLLVGTKGGIFTIKNEQIDTLLKTNEQIKSITSLDMIEGELWIGNASTGLFNYDIQNDSLKSILNTSYVRRIRPDSDSTVLVCTNEGLFIVHTKTQKTIQHYTTKDGIPFNEIQDVYADGDRYIYIATTNGMALLDRQIKTPVSISSKDLSIDQVLINNKKVATQSTYDFSYQENNLRLNYHLRSYASNGEIQYYSKLEPLQKEWQKSKERSASYFGLNPGEYSFHLKAEDVYGNTISMGEPLSIHIRKAYWQTYWFRILTLLLLIGGLIYLMVKREKRQKESLEKEKQLNRRMATLELSALKAQMNPHFVFNALGAIQYYIQVHEVEAADAYLTRFAQLMRRFLDSSKEKLISLKDEIDLLTIYTDLEKMRFESKFSVDIIVDKDLGLEDHYLPSMMIQPFIENAINHGLSERNDGKAALIVSFYKKDKTLYCEVNDNGIGREHAKKSKRKGHHSRGMSIIQEKIQTLKISGLADVALQIQDLDPSNSQYPGTQIILTLKTIDDDEN